jgi:hypothetical protein
MIASPEKSLRDIEECREEIAEERDLYQGLLTAFHVEANSPLRPVTTTTKSDAPFKFTSKWKKIIRLAISKCGEKAHYGIIAKLS